MKILSLSTYLTFFSPIITMSFESHLKYKFLLKNALISSILGLLTISICSLIGNIALYAIFISGIISDLSYYILNILDFKKETTRLPFSYRNFILFFIPIILTLLQSVLDISEVNLAILETSGTLAVFSKKRYKEIFLPVVISGKLENENIKLLGLSKNYILKRLNEKKLKLKDIAFFSLSEINEGSLFLFK